MSDRINFEDRVLIKLKRTYTKDETIQALNKKIESLEVEKGQLLSEIEHLNYTIKEKKAQEIRDLEGLFRESSLYKQQKKIIRDRGEKIRNLMVDLRRLATKN